MCRTLRGAGWRRSRSRRVTCWTSTSRYAFMSLVTGVTGADRTSQEVEQRKWYGFWDYGDVMHTYGKPTIRSTFTSPN